MSKDENEHIKKNPLPAGTNLKAIHRFQQRQDKEIDINRLFEGIRNSETTALSKAITLVESTQKKHSAHAQHLIEKCLPYANKSIRIGVTGVSGVGKSTFIEAFGNLLLTKGKKVAVLAVDPSSSVSKGSILGDKTRMESLVRSNNVFIRPSPAGNSLGGVAQKTRESIILSEAAGYDTIIIETVGVGQSETLVHGMVDFFLLLKLAGAGDELQGIKRGIIEMADAIVINKADGENQTPALYAKNQFKKALHLYPEKENQWIPEVLVCSALKNTGIGEIWNLIDTYMKQTTQTGYFDLHRKKQNQSWLLQTIENELKNSFYSHPEIKKETLRYIKSVQSNKITPFAAAKHLLDIFNKKE